MATTSTTIQRRVREFIATHSIFEPGPVVVACSGGLQVVMDRCCKIEHARFFGGLRTIGLNTGVMTSRLAMRLPEG